jgi:formylmethanofuran dehydrogenase subunit E-like metal-binding protein
MLSCTDPDVLNATNSHAKFCKSVETGYLVGSFRKKLMPALPGELTIFSV